MNTDEVLAGEIIGHGAYVCGRGATGPEAARRAAAPLGALAARLGLANEFDGAPPPSARGSYALVRRQGVTPRDIADEGVAEAEWLIHVASKDGAVVDEFCAGAEAALAPLARTRVLRGVVRPRTYTGAAMNRWAYERAVGQRPGSEMPNAFLLPMSKIAEWWTKDWMERHTYFLPRYDDDGRMLNEGHALATEAGIPCILRRTYRALEHPAAAGSYDFITYFECADVDVPVFETICANLRDVRRNPEWKFVREGPTWRGRRVLEWAALFTEETSHA